MKLSRILFLCLAVTLAVSALAALALGSQAATTMRVWGDPHVSVVADTGDGMAAPLKALATAWQAELGDSGRAPTCHEIPCGPLTATFKLFAFRDQATYLGGSDNAGEMGTWLSGLKTSEDDTCPDDSLRALGLAAHTTDPEHLGSTRTLLATDSAPFGDRRALAATLHRLQRSDTRLYQMVNGWCAFAPLQPAEFLFLSQATGGIAAARVITLDIPPPLTSTFSILLAQMAAPDTVSASRGQVMPGDNVDEIGFVVDGSMSGITVLGVDDEPEWWPQCLTCTRGLAASTPLSFALRAPGGQIITPGSPGVEVTTAGNMQQFALSFEPGNIPTGMWAVLAKGEGAYQVRVVADSETHFGYEGKHSLPAGREVGLRAFALDGKGNEVRGAAAFEAIEFGLVSVDGRWLRTLDLRDDGQSGDEVAGDGHYYGDVTLKRGVFLLAARGRLGDGSPFYRIDPAPLRVRRFRAEGPPSVATMPAATASRAFTMTNDADSAQTFDLLLTSSQGWAITDTVPASTTLAAGETMGFRVPVEVPPGTAAGSEEVTTLTILSEEGLYASESVEARTRVEGSNLFLPLIRDN